MAGLGLKDLPLPPRRYDPLATVGFEDCEFAEEQDRAIRGPQLLEQSFAGGMLINRPRALDLGKRLSGGNEPETLASSRYMMDCRRRVIGGVWQLHDELGEECGSTFHLIAERSTVSAEQLMSCDARLLANALRSDVNRTRVPTGVPSCLLAFLHGEWNLATESFSLHWHGYAAGGYLTAINALRRRPKYKAKAKCDGRDAVAKPVLIKREPLTDLPYPLTYILKSYWPAVWGAKGDDGYLIRGTRVHRIPEPYHSLALLWQDRWVLGDVSLVMGMRVTRQGLTLANA